MNKLLLLATVLVSLTVHDFAAATPKRVFNDSNSQKIVNLKDAFKDLFETETLNGINVSKLNVKAQKFVEDYMDKEGKRLEKMKTWGKPYFNLMDKALADAGLPVELKYLAVIESELKSTATSWVGAKGPWQLMPGTARDLGLVVNGRIDQRTDYYKSTRAAAKYLSELYDIYNDWPLVIAAYNCGPGNVDKAIEKSGSRDFWNLQYYLPAESRNHVKKFIATHYIMQGEGSIATLSKPEIVNLGIQSADINKSSLASLDITGKFNSYAIAQTLNIDIAEFTKLNPNFDKQLSADGKYKMKLPNEKMEQFKANKNQILEQSIRMMLSTASR